MAFEYTKQPWEEEIIGIDFSRRIPAGKTILTPASDVTEVKIEEIISPSRLNPSDYGGHVTISSVALSGIVGREKILVALISGGVDGFQYRVTFRVTLSDGQKKEDDVLVIIKET
jgi:hypothetical protein